MSLEMDRRERAERKLIEDIWKQTMHINSHHALVVSDLEWQFYRALLNAKAERMLPVGVLS